MTFTGAGGTATPDWGVSGDSQWGVQDWQLHYEQRQHETPYFLPDGTAYTPLAEGLVRWSVIVRFLIDSALPATDLAVGAEVVVSLYGNATDYFSGACTIEMFDVNNPLDGPYGAVARLHGSGTLTIASTQ